MNNSFELKIPSTRVSFAFPFRLNPGKTTLTAMGSCFTEHLAELLENCGIPTALNPGGILYNPCSLAESLLRCTENIPYTERDFFKYDGLYHSFGLHGAFSKSVLNDAVETAEKSRTAFRDRLKKSDLLIVTFGTAVVFETVPDGQIAGNCHKLPSNLFTRRVLSHAECFRAMESIAETMEKFRPECRIVFSVSPVRHHPGDPVLNSYSKSTLISAVRELCEKSGKLFYFPSFEILNDELRDYRFYAEDLVHPSETAVKMILRSFMNACFGPEGVLLSEKAEKCRSAKKHIPIHTEKI